MARIFALALMLATGMPARSADSALRPDYLVFNAKVPIAAGAPTHHTLYLSRRGYYVGEVFLEPAAAAAASKHPIDLGFTMNFFDHGRKVYSYAFDRPIAPGTQSATLFDVKTDRELPLRRKLDVTIEVHPQKGAKKVQIASLNIQIKRSPAFLLPGA